MPARGFALVQVARREGAGVMLAASQWDNAEDDVKIEDVRTSLQGVDDELARRIAWVCEQAEDARSRITAAEADRAWAEEELWDAERERDDLQDEVDALEDELKRKAAS